MKNDIISQATDSVHSKVRLHYLDWLRVLAILMVFLFHAVHPFDFGEWHVKNVEG
jgi:peptidoglycan/LPS O-acetylase OafA/YrhL